MSCDVEKPEPWYLNKGIQVVLAVTVSSTLLTFPTGDDCGHGYFAYWLVWLSTVGAGVVAGCLLRQFQSPHLRCAAGYAVLNWLRGLLTGMAVLLDTSCALGVLRLCIQCAEAVLYNTLIVMFWTSLFWMQILVLSRIRALERSSKLRFGSKPILVVSIVQFLSLFFLLLYTTWGAGTLNAPWALSLVTFSVAGTFFMVVCCLIVCSLSGAVCRLHHIRKAMAPEQYLDSVTRMAVELCQADLRRAKRAALEQLFGVAASLLTSCLAICGLFLLNQTFDDPIFSAIFLSLDLAANSIGVLLLSGGHRTSALRRLECAAAIVDTAGPGCFAFQSSWVGKVTEPGPAADLDWMAKVEALAGRGVTLRSVLSFYRGLGREYMPHFDPGVHTTNDVVRQAVIPLTKPKCEALAQQLMHDTPTYPQTMVTHNWSNLFRDLVAAIIAHALRETTYGMVARLLDDDTSVLERMLSAAGCLDDTYWICAFSVNQHIGICCDNSRGEVDSVSGLVHPVCDCHLPKHFNTTPPLATDGRSIGCEMNKFEDMMALLARRDQRFAQVIAVDAHFDLFSRAWCVAELAEARRKGMPQHLLLASQNSPEAYADKLQHLRVEDMRASRPEDVAEILSKIPDKPAFNRSLHSLIFDQNCGLLAGWRGLDSQRRLGEAGRLLAWHNADAGSGAVWRSWGQ